MESVLQALTVLRQPFAAISEFAGLSEIMQPYEFTGSQEFAAKVSDFAGLLQEQAKTLAARIGPELIAEIYSFLDITSLDSLDSEKKINNFISLFLNNQISELRPAAFCVFPVFIERAKELLAGSKIQLAAVESAFPHGQSLLESRIEDVKRIVSAGADEVDAVIRRGLPVCGEWEKLEQEIFSLKTACGDKKLKIILNTQELFKDKPDRLSEIYKISRTAIMARADMLKSSTGKEAINADLKDCIVMCRAILDFNPKTGFKAAGGIKTLESALAYYLLAKLTYGEFLSRDNFRIGASSLAEVLQKSYLDPSSSSSADMGAY